jgi:hypothetical protein
VPGLDCADAAARSDSGRVRLGDDAAAGMTGGPRLSAAVARDSGGAGWRGLLGRLVGLVVMRCHAGWSERSGLLLPLGCAGWRNCTGLAAVACWAGWRVRYNRV